MEVFSKTTQNFSTSHANTNPPGLTDLKDGFQAVFKIWSAFGKTLRQIVLKYVDDDVVIKTGYFGKFYVPKLDRKQYGIHRNIVYQPPLQLQKVCSQVLNDRYTIPAEEKYEFPSSLKLRDSEPQVCKEVKLNMMTIAKMAEQSFTLVEQSL